MRVYLIDIDGTLLLSGGAGFAALELAFEELHGVRGAMQTVRPGGKTDPLIVTEGFLAALRRPPRPGEVDRLLQRYLVHLPVAVRESQRFRVYPGVRRGLSALQAQGHVLAVDRAVVSLQQPLLAAEVVVGVAQRDFGAFGDLAHGRFLVHRPQAYLQRLWNLTAGRVAVKDSAHKLKE